MTYESFIKERVSINFMITQKLQGVPLNMA